MACYLIWSFLVWIIKRFLFCRRFRLDLILISHDFNLFKIGSIRLVFLHFYFIFFVSANFKQFLVDLVACFVNAFWRYLVCHLKVLMSFIGLIYRRIKSNMRTDDESALLNLLLMLIRKFKWLYFKLFLFDFNFLFIKLGDCFYKQYLLSSFFFIRLILIDDWIFSSNYILFC